MTQYAILRNKKQDYKTVDGLMFEKQKDIIAVLKVKQSTKKTKTTYTPEMSEYNQTFEYGTGNNLVDKIKNRISEAGVKEKLHLMQLLPLNQ